MNKKIPAVWIFVTAILLLVIGSIVGGIVGSAMMLLGIVALLDAIVEFLRARRQRKNAINAEY